MSEGGRPSRVIILHGARGGPDTNWFPWLHAALETEGFEVVRPRFPTPEGQTLAAWFEAYDRATATLPPARTVLVGHSLGAAFALRVIERGEAPVAGVFLAAGFLGALGLAEYDKINSSFFAKPFDWTAIRAKKGSACRCWGSDDDPYVPLPRAQEIADCLEAPFETVAGGGHLNDETGFTRFPQILSAILKP